MMSHTKKKTKTREGGKGHRDICTQYNLHPMALVLPLLHVLPLAALESNKKQRVIELYDTPEYYSTPPLAMRRAPTVRPDSRMHALQIAVISVR